MGGLKVNLGGPHIRSYNHRGYFENDIVGKKKMRHSNAKITSISALLKRAIKNINFIQNYMGCNQNT